MPIGQRTLKPIVVGSKSDPSPIIEYPCQKLTNSLRHCCLLYLIDMTLACEVANSILVEVVTVDAEKRVDNSLVQILKLKFGQYFVKLSFDIQNSI